MKADRYKVRMYSKPGVVEVIERPSVKTPMKCWICHRNPCVCEMG